MVAVDFSATFVRMRSVGRTRVGSRPIPVEWWPIKAERISPPGSSLPSSDQLQPGPDPTDQLLTNFGIRWSFRRITGKKALPDKPIFDKYFRVKAGDGIRAHDAQIGNSVRGAHTLFSQGFISRFSAKNEDYKWVASH